MVNEFFEKGTTPARRKEIRDKLESQDFITPQMQKLMKDLNDVGVSNVFRQPEKDGGLGDDEDTVLRLESKIPNGLLTLNDLIDERGNLTQETFRSLMNDVASIRKDQWTEAAKYIGVEFNYAEERANSIEPYEEKAKLSYRRANRQWLKYKRSNPMATSAEMEKELKRIIDAEWVQLDLVLGIELKAEVRALKNFPGLLDKIPVLSNGDYDYSQVEPVITQHIAENPNSATQLAPRIDEILYLIDMVGSR